MINAFFWIALMYVGISGLWVQTEKIIYGKVTPRIIDDFVAIALAVSLYLYPLIRGRKHGCSC